MKVRHKNGNLYKGEFQPITWWQLKLDQFNDWRGVISHPLLRFAVGTPA